MSVCVSVCVSKCMFVCVRETEREGRVDVVFLFCHLQH